MESNLLLYSSLSITTNILHLSAFLTIISSLFFKLLAASHKRGVRRVLRPSTLTLVASPRSWSLNPADTVIFRSVSSFSIESYRISISVALMYLSNFELTWQLRPKLSSSFSGSVKQCFERLTYWSRDSGSLRVPLYNLFNSLSILVSSLRLRLPSSWLIIVWQPSNVSAPIRDRISFSMAFNSAASSNFLPLAFDSWLATVSIRNWAVWACVARSWPISLYLGSKLSLIHVLLKRMAHSLFIIFFLVFSYFLISFIFLWSFDCVLKKYVQQKQSQSQETPNQTLDLFYRNQMTSSYKIDEKVLKNIIKQNIKCTNENESIKLNIYYKNRKVSNLVMKNSPNTTKLQRTNILYKYECNVGDCEPQAYIGYTHTTLSRRITMHLQSGAPLKHSQDFHNSTLNREQMVSSTSVIRQENDFNRLEIMEALYIKYTKPEINLQITGMGRTLRLLGDKDTCHTTNSRIQHPALAVTTHNSPALPNTQ